MSMWNCVEHGFTGGNLCCSRASRVEVDPIQNNDNDEKWKQMNKPLDNLIEVVKRVLLIVGNESHKRKEQ